MCENGVFLLIGSQLFGKAASIHERAIDLRVISIVYSICQSLLNNLKYYLKVTKFSDTLNLAIFM